MKRLIIINILLVLALNILPKEVKVEAKEEVLQTAEITAEIASRSSEPRQEISVETDKEQSKPTEISQEGIDFIKQYEGFIPVATRLAGEQYMTLGYRSLW